jgi:hypothetical protein
MAKIESNSLQQIYLCPLLGWNAMRFLRIFVYFTITFAGLFLLYKGDTFCREGNHSAILPIMRLALACTAWDFLISSCVFLVRKSVRNKQLMIVRFSWFAALLSAGLIGIGIGSIPFWIYQGHSIFEFANVLLNVNCLFMEGYGMVFHIIVAPPLALLAFLCDAVGLQPTKGLPAK